MRGQLNLEFIISAGLFLSLLSFVALKATTSYFLAHSQARGEVMYARAYAISGLLVKYPGKPANWDSVDEIEIVGLSAGEPLVLSEEKLLAINACSQATYERLREALGLKLSERFVLEVKVFNGTELVPYVSCTPPVISLLAPKFPVRRYVIICNGKCRVARLDLTLY